MRLLLMALATWRLTSMLYTEKGPGKVFNRLRGLVGIGHDDLGPVTYPNSFLGGLFQCFWCLSVWVSLVVVLGGWLVPAQAPIDVTEGVLLWLASSTGSIIIQAWMETRGNL